MSKQSYTNVHDERLTLVPNGDHVLVYTAKRTIGGFSLERFGESPLTPAGRLTTQAVRTFTDYLASLT